MSPSSSTESKKKSSSSTADAKSPSSSTADTTNSSSSTGNSSSSTESITNTTTNTKRFVAVSTPSSISGRSPVSSYSCDFVSVPPISTILYDVRRCVRDSSVEYSVVGDSLYLTKGNVRSLRISCDDSSCKLWICSCGKETLDAEFAIWNAGKIASIYVDKYRFLE